MALHNKLSRRSLIAGAGVAAAAAAAGALNPFGPAVFAGNGRLIPAGKVGTITFTQRDVPGRLGIAASEAAGLSPTMGRVGGPNFPEDPTDLGPLVPLPGGWQELLQFLAAAGYHQIEFAGYGQNANNPGGTASYPGDGNAAGRANYRPTRSGCAGSSTTPASRRSATTASSPTPGSAPTAPAAP